MLLGGLVLATHDRLVPIPVPAPTALRARASARSCWRRGARARRCAGHYALGEFVAQSANLALLLAGCYRNDLDLIRHGLADVLVEPRRAALIPGFAAVKQAALDAGALGASISGAGPSVFAWCARRRRSPRWRSRAMQAGFAAVGLDSRCAVVAGRRPGCRVAAMKFVSTRGAAPGRRPVGGAARGARARRRSVRAGAVTALGIADFEGARRAGGGRRAPAGAVLRRRRAGSCLARDLSRCAGPAGAAHRAGRGHLGAGAVPRPHRRVQGFRRALPRRVPRARAARRRAADHDPGRDLGRHRQRGRRGLPSPARLPGRDPLSRGPGLAAPGASARLPRRQRARLPRGRQLRRLPAPGQAGLRRRRAARTHAAGLGQQHQPGPPAAADGVLRPRRARACPPRRRATGLHRPHRQPGQCVRRLDGARDGPAHRRGAPGHQRQPHAARFPRQRALRGPRQRGDDGQCHGRGRSLQRRAPALAASRHRCAARGGQRRFRRRRHHRRADPRGRVALRPGLVPAHGLRRGSPAASARGG